MPADSTRDLSHALAIAIGKLNRRMRSSETEALGHGHLSTLGTLSKSPPLRLGELATREVVSAPSMTRTVSDLERRGLVRRLPDPDDKRSVLVQLTQEGEDTVREARSHRAELLGGLLVGLSAGDLKKLDAALPLLEQMAEQQRR